MDFMTIFAGTSASVWPEFSDLMDSIRDQFQAMKEKLQSTTQDLQESLVDKVQALAEKVDKQQRVIDRLLELFTRGSSPEAKQDDEKSPDYIA